MKLLISAFFLINSFSSNCQPFGQPPHSLRFIHYGNESKPIGTIVISVERLVIPNEKKLDFLFGKSVVTDLFTFNILDNFIKKNTLLVQENKEKSVDMGYFEIIDQNNFALYLNFSNIKLFFAELRKEIQINLADTKILIPFDKL